MTETPYGGIVKSLMNEGAQLGVSSRGMGSLRPNKQGINEVQKDFYLATAADIVADPSAPNAFVEGIMEGAEWIFDDSKGIWVQESADRMRTEMKQMSAKEIESKKFKMFEQFLNTLTK